MLGRLEQHAAVLEVSELEKRVLALEADAAKKVA